MYKDLLRSKKIDQQIVHGSDCQSTTNLRLDEVLDKDAVCHRFCVINTASTLRRKLVKVLEI